MVTLIEIILQQWNDKTGKHQRIEGIIIDNLLAAMSTVHLKSGNHFRRSRYLLTRGFFWRAWGSGIYSYRSSVFVDWVIRKGLKSKGDIDYKKKKEIILQCKSPCHNATFWLIRHLWTNEMRYEYSISFANLDTQTEGFFFYSFVSIFLLFFLL